MTTIAVIEKKKVIQRQIKEPGKYKVIVCNDDVTPMEFVAAMLVSIFNHDPDQALELVLIIHNQGSAIAGVYPCEVAEQKCIDSTTMAQLNGYPLIIKMEEE